MRLVEVLSRLYVQWSVKGQFQVAEQVSIQHRRRERVTNLMMWFSGVLTVRDDEVTLPAGSLSYLPSWLAFDSSMLVSLVVCTADAFCLQTSMNWNSYQRSKTVNFMNISSYLPIYQSQHTGGFQLFICPTSALASRRLSPHFEGFTWF